jgi:hypothetical protein
MDSPCGRLAVRARSPYSAAPDWQLSWQEQRESDLLKRIPTITKAIVDAAPALALSVQQGQQKLDEEHRRWQQEAEASSRRFEEARRVRAREEDREELLALIDEWHLDGKVVAFLSEARTQIEAITDETQRLAASHQLAEAHAMFVSTSALAALQRWHSGENRHQ